MDPSNLEPVLAKGSRLLVAAFYAFTPLDDERREALLIRTEAGFRGQAREWKGLCPPSKIRLPIG